MDHAQTKLSLILLFLLLSGCTNVFAPPEGELGGTPEFIITNQETPTETLMNFEYAYNFQDTVVYNRILADSFEFVFINYNATSPRLEKWGKNIEILQTSRLFKTYPDIRLTFEKTIRDRDSVDQRTKEQLPSDLVRCNLEKELSLQLSNDQDIHQFTGTADFSFAKDTLTNIWKISKWVDYSINR